MRKLLIASLALGGICAAAPVVAGPVIVTQPSVDRAAQPPQATQEVHWRGGRGWHHGWGRGHHYGWRHRHWGWRHRHWG
ncbi:MAG: hypothetical protein U1E28_20295 [Beijerinckiaceae bacterium]